MRINRSLNANNEMRCTMQAMLTLLVAFWQYERLQVLTRSQQYVYESKVPEPTLFKPHLYHSILYNDCRCSVLSTEYCLTDDQLRASRYVPLILFVSQIYLDQDIFSLSGDHRQIVIRMLWGTIMLIFLSILAIIYQYNYYYGDVATFLIVTADLLFASVSYEAFISERYRNGSIRNNHNISHGQGMRDTGY